MINQPKFQRVITGTVLTTYMCASLLGCATVYPQGTGVIISERKIGEKDYSPHEDTKNFAITGAKVGATYGAVGGGLMGAAVGGWASGGQITGYLLGGVVFGTIFAILYGIEAGLVGGGVGYVSDLVTRGAGMYEFTVKPDNASTPIVIKQYSAPIPLHTPVQIIKKENTLSLKLI